MSDDKLRAALESTKEFIRKWSLGELNTTLARDYPEIVMQIDEALKSEPAENPDDGLDAFKQTKEKITEPAAEVYDLKELVWQSSPSHIRNQLLNLPDLIQAQNLEVAKTAELIEQRRAEVAVIEAEVEGIIAKDEGLTNADKRKAAKKLALKDRGDYAGKCADLAILERASKLEEVELTHLNNLFKAYLAISGMGQVR